MREVRSGRREGRGRASPCRGDRRGAGGASEKGGKAWACIAVSGDRRGAGGAFEKGGKAWACTAVSGDRRGAGGAF